MIFVNSLPNRFFRQYFSEKFCFEILWEKYSRAPRKISEKMENEEKRLGEQHEKPKALN